MSKGTFIEMININRPHGEQHVSKFNPNVDEKVKSSSLFLVWALRGCVNIGLEFSFSYYKVTIRYYRFFF
jgi:hypothetical protein